MSEERRPTLLIVDDEEANLDYYERVLGDEFALLKARDGVEALDRFQRFAPDLVLMDLVMPHLNGFELCARIKHSPRGPATPVILLTGMADDALLALAKQNGADLLLGKPILPTVLREQIHSLLPAA